MLIGYRLSSSLIRCCSNRLCSRVYLQVSRSRVFFHLFISPASLASFFETDLWWLLVPPLIHLLRCCFDVRNTRQLSIQSSACTSLDDETSASFVRSQSALLAAASFDVLPMHQYIGCIELTVPGYSFDDILRTMKLLMEIIVYIQRNQMKLQSLCMNGIKRK